jgi:hypothetical protein
MLLMVILECHGQEVNFDQAGFLIHHGARKENNAFCWALIELNCSIPSKGSSINRKTITPST